MLHGCECIWTSTLLSIQGLFRLVNSLVPVNANMSHHQKWTFSRTQTSPRRWLPAKNVDSHGKKMQVAIADHLRSCPYFKRQQGGVDHKGQVWDTRQHKFVDWQDAKLRLQTWFLMRTEKLYHCSSFIFILSFFHILGTFLKSCLWSVCIQYSQWMSCKINLWQNACTFHTYRNCAWLSLSTDISLLTIQIRISLTTLVCCAEINLAARDVSPLVQVPVVVQFYILATGRKYLACAQMITHGGHSMCRHPAPNFSMSLWEGPSL